MDITACIACGPQCIKEESEYESFIKELQKRKYFSKINYRPAPHPFLFMKTTRLSASPHTCTCNVRSTPHPQGCRRVDASTTGMVWLPMADTPFVNRPACIVTRCWHSRASCMSCVTSTRMCCPAPGSAQAPDVRIAPAGIAPAKAELLGYVYSFHAQPPTTRQW